MSDTAAANSNQPDQPVRSPFAGCLIFIIIAVVAIFVVVFSAYSFKKQTEGFASFSETEEVKTPIAPINGSDLLETKLSDLETPITEKLPAELSLSKDEINLAIAHFPQLENIRGALNITDITGGTLKGQLHLPLASTKDLPEILCKALGIEQRDNFLRATITAVPVLTDGQLFLKIETLTPSRGEAPEQVLQAISPFRIFTDLPENSRTQKTLSQLTSAEITDNKLLLTYSPDATPPSGKEEADELAEKARHLVALGAVIFLLTMILFFVILAKRKKAAVN